MGRRGTVPLLVHVVRRLHHAVQGKHAHTGKMVVGGFLETIARFEVTDLLVSLPEYKRVVHNDTVALNDLLGNVNT